MARRVMRQRTNRPNGAHMKQGFAIVETYCTATGLLSARRERPGDRRAAERDQQLPPPDSDCHTPLPREVRKGNDTTPRAGCP
jgi:hypothetical protein